MGSRCLLFVAAFLSAACASTTAHATVLFTGRTIVATIVSNRADFSDAFLTVDATTYVEADMPGSRGISFTPLAGFATGTYSTTGGVSLRDYSIDPDQGSGEVVATSSGTFTLHNVYTTGRDDPYAVASLFRYSNASTAPPPFDDRSDPILELFLGVGGGGQIDDGGTFRFTLIVPGDFSSQAGLDAAPGQYFDGGALTPGFEVERNYEYDRRTGTTVLSLVNPSFRGATDFVGLDTYFIGRSLGAVPEPSTWSMMILGVGVIGHALRRRDARKATAPMRHA